MSARASKIAYLMVPLALAAGLVVLAGLTAQRKVESFQPLGFVAQSEGGGWQVVAVDDPATGLEAGDRILAVNGSPATQAGALRSSLLGRPESQLLISRGLIPQEVLYSRPGLQIDFRYLFLALVGALYLVIGLYTAVKLRRRQGLLFFLWCLASAGLYLVSPAGGSFDTTGRMLYWADEVARLLMAPLMVHLFLSFPRPLGVGSRMRRLLPYVYLPAVALLFLRLDLILPSFNLVYGAPTAAAIDRLDSMGRMHLGLGIVVSLLLLAFRLARPAGVEERRQSQWIAVGLATGFVPYLLLEALPRALSWVPPVPVTTVSVLPMILVPLAFAYAILRYKLWDLQVIVRDAVASTLTLLVGAVGFSLIDLTISRGLPEGMVGAQNLLTFAAGVAIAGVLVPARRGIAHSLERFQYRGSYGLRRSLGDLGRQLLHERDLDRLCATLIDRLQEGVELPRINLLLTQGASLVAVRPHAPRLVDPSAEQLPEVDVPPQLPLDVFGEDAWDSEVASLSGIDLEEGEVSAEQSLFITGYRYAFPLKVRDQPVGFLLTSYRAERSPLTSEDEELIRQVLNQAALAIENAQLLDRLHVQLDEVGRLQRYNEGILESLPAGIAVLDRDDQVVSANLGFAALAGVERRSLLDRSLTEILPVEVPAPDEGLRQVTFERPGGRERTLQVGTALLDGSAETGRRILVLQDVTDRIDLENELKEKDRLASLGMLAAGVAHEVNTPITGISSYAQMLLEDTPNEDPRRRLLEKVERQTFRAASIVNNLLEFARNRVERKGTLSLAPVVSESADLLGERLAEAEVTLYWEAPVEELRVDGNETELHQVFTNLLVNAIDAMRGGGSITIWDRSDEATVRLEFEDDGPGIPEEDLEKVFQPFYSTKLGEGGTGLGLSISYEIVRRHGGRLRVSSRPGEGTSFTVELPRHASGNQGGSQGENQEAAG